MAAERLARIPKRFYRDHIERELPAPPIQRETKSHYYIYVDHSDAHELLNDAEHYSDPSDWEPELLGLYSSARATAKALRDAEEA